MKLSSLKISDGALSNIDAKASFFLSLNKHQMIEHDMQ